MVLRVFFCSARQGVFLCLVLTFVPCLPTEDDQAPSITPEAFPFP
jgi:hypothetical protein